MKATGENCVVHVAIIMKESSCSSSIGKAWLYHSSMSSTIWPADDSLCRGKIMWQGQWRTKHEEHGRRGVYKLSTPTSVNTFYTCTACFWFCCLGDSECNTRIFITTQHNTSQHTTRCSCLPYCRKLVKQSAFLKTIWKQQGKIALCMLQ